MLTKTSGLCCFLSAVLHTAFVGGDESVCTVKSNGNGSVKIICTISQAAFLEGQSFNLYFHTGEKKERVAELNYVRAFYLCHPLKGYLCQTLSNHIFAITSSSCEPTGEFMFFADGEQPERCRNTTPEDDIKQLHGRREEITNNHHLGFNTNNNKEGELGRENDTQTRGLSSLAIGLTVCGVLTAMIIVSLVVFILRRNRLKQNNRDGKDVKLQKSTENTNDPLILSGCNGQPIRLEETERNIYLLNKETSDHI